MRRLPFLLSLLVCASLGAQDFTLNIPALPDGKSTTITWTQTVVKQTPPNATATTYNVTEQASFTSDQNGTPIVSDDPATGTANDATATVVRWRPDPPAAPDLQAADDSGAFATDNITNVTTPRFDGSVSSPSTALTVRLKADGSEVASTTATGAFTLQPGSPLSDGAKAMTLTAQYDTGDADSESAPSPALSTTIDTGAPTITSITRQSPASAYLQTGPVTFRVVFSEAMTALTPADFTGTVDGAPDGTITVSVVEANPPADGTTWDVTLGNLPEGDIGLQAN